MDCLIQNARVVEPERVRTADLLIRDGVIAKIGRVKAPRDARVIRGDKLLALPGFIDIHTHGAVGFDLTSGQFDAKRGVFISAPDAWRRGIPAVMKRYATEGVTRALLATAADPMRRLEMALSLAADYVESERNGVEGTRLEGTNLEGTFLSNPKNAGAQNPKNFVIPTRAAYERLQRAARGTLRYVNCVPERGRAAVELTCHMTRQGVLVGAGHTSCAAEQADRCRKVGLRVCVHMLNGPTGTSFKPFGGGNMVEFFLTRPDLYVELICDGYHIAPAYVLDVIERKGFDRVVLVTDAMFAKGAPGVTEFGFGGLVGQLDPNGEVLRVKGSPDNTLFGSVLAMPRAFSNVLSWLTSDMPGVWHGDRRAMETDEALVGLARAASANPARLIGLDRKVPSRIGSGTGALVEGKCADLTLAELSGRPGAYRLKVKHTMIEGRLVV